MLALSHYGASNHEERTALIIALEVVGFMRSSKCTQNKARGGSSGKLASLLLLLASLLESPASIVTAFRHNSCSRTVRPQFQFPDCYLPDLNPDILLSEASFLLSHDAATGYLRAGQPNPWGQVITFYGKNQVGDAYQQLDDGARALDLRPKLLANGTMIYHHGDVNIPVPMERLTEDVVRWCADNPTELVLLLHSELGYEDDSTVYDDNGDLLAIDAIQSVYDNVNVPYVRCGDVYGLTVGEVMEMAALSSGGLALALDGHDQYASFCGKSNWIESQVVTCYPYGMNSTVRCTNGRGSVPMQMLKEYILVSANNEATDDSGTLGPPADLEAHPFNEIQALWQISAKSAATGLAHLSSLLEDNRRSHVNAEMVDMIWDGEFSQISLFAIDNVHLNGNAILSVLRNTCGQSDIEACGKDVAKPKMTYLHYGSIGAWLLATAIGSLVLWRGSVEWRKRIQERGVAGLGEDFMEGCGGVMT
mmetsp:Transcript_28006/g.80956  ORF Transcript_28006/g.80956 Transcript_28006/m.80956 type:complete len:478 (-) Transcript_28006:29-1462(-)